MSVADPVPGMGMPRPGRRDQLPGAGGRAASRPNRPSSASKSSALRPCQRIAACARAATRARASPSSDPSASAGEGSRPSGGLDDGGEAAELGRGFLEQLPGPGADAAQPAAHGRGRDAQLRAEPRCADAVQRRHGGRPGRSRPRCPRAGAPSPREQDVRRAAGPAPRPPGTRMTRSRP
ncbi:MAG TPA: hypothetical protein VHZ03_22515 [Trebonia sp.]|nr:hypothetical protein [Trebonia sp.]